MAPTWPHMNCTAAASHTTTHTAGVSLAWGLSSKVPCLSAGIPSVHCLQRCAWVYDAQAACTALPCRGIERAALLAISYDIYGA